MFCCTSRLILARRAGSHRLCVVAQGLAYLPRPLCGSQGPDQGMDDETRALAKDRAQGLAGAPHL